MTQVQPDPALAVKQPTDATRAAQLDFIAGLPFDDVRDLEDSSRGFIATLDPPRITFPDGSLVFDLSGYEFVTDAEAPPSVNPSLWRHALVNKPHGLFEVMEGVYQLRGLDISNMTIIEGDTGIIVIDPMTYMETAKAGLELYFRHRPARPVKAVIYTHSHADHYGGVRSVIDEADVRAGRTQVIAPAGFLKEAVAENVYAGNAMARRAIYMYGNVLKRGIQGQINAGLGNGLPHGGTASLIAPSDTITTTGDRRTVDGVEMVFQMAPGTEAPAEFLIHFPGKRLMCAAEDATHTMHNLYTLRGAQVRDAATWWKVLDETIEMFGADTDVVIAQHQWPRWGNADVVQFLEQQRDLYKYLHDQSLRLANQGYTMSEVAERIELPPGLAGQWHCRGYYGSAKHNSKAVYQRYLGWYDSHPAHLDPLQPQDSAPKYVEYMGGAKAILERARAAYAAGEYRWVAEVLTHVVFADPRNTDARDLQADAFEQLGYQAENGTWRNEYLMGAKELREGVHDLGAIQLAGSDVLAAMPVEMLLDYLGIHLDGPAAWLRTGAFNWVFADFDGVEKRFAVRLSNGTLVYTAEKTLPDPDATVYWDREAFQNIILGTTTLDQAIASGAVRVDGDTAALSGLFELFDTFPFWFPIVTP
ncbi:alkyl/aryl-sulfatase [Nocardia macrotermitis]|uniref:Linear primary-alkylsulfatase n=1 Tax=Nocardia macrotermitis TaxID=2585198 RepID=A0A7K0D5Q9_9NOCA|nr:alkyl sulfatase dimerization domain-containing protein [Nocardia macrotermitis]MQY21083.1 putative alkyl/aryl-sulfatase YjcS [Nocardia macrotermitis]